MASETPSDGVTSTSGALASPLIKAASDVSTEPGVEASASPKMAQPAPAADDGKVSVSCPSPWPVVAAAVTATTGASPCSSVVSSGAGSAQASPRPSPAPTSSTGRRSSLLGRSLGPLTVNGIRHATLTLTSTALGGGVLSVSYVMQLAGLGLGLGMLLTGGLLAYLSITALMRMSIETGNETYAGLLSHCAGPRAGPILDSLLFLYGCGSCMGYFVFLGDFLPALVDFCAPQAPRWCASRETAISICALAVLPLAVQRDVSALRYVSPVSICALMYMAIVVAAKAPGEYDSHLHDPAYGQIEIFHFDLHFSEAFALCIFAFNCHLNVVPVAATMVAPTKARIMKISYRVNVLQLAFYCLIGVAGYLSFLAKTPQDILTGYPSGDYFVAGGRFMLTGTMLVAIPLNLNPTIRSALQIGDYLRGDLSPPENRPAAPRVLLTVVCILCQALLAIKVPGVADVLSILGATVATAMMLALPAYCIGVIMPRTTKTRIQQAIFLVFSIVSVASVPIKILRMLKVLPA